MYRGMPLLHFVILISKIHGSVFDLTDAYVDEFAHGIENLEKLADETDFHEGSYDPFKFNETKALKDAKEYDFIVVGAGSAGAVVAARLSEIPEWTVLLLEAGAPESPHGQVPALRSVLERTPYNWGYTTEREESWCLGMADQKCAWACGKALGGSSAINGMVYTRGNKKDYDLWADQGNEGWCYNDVLPYFKKSEDAHLPHFDHKYHSQGGPVHVEVPQYLSPLAETFLEASKGIGFEIVDYNGKEQLGSAILQTSMKDGKRNSMASAFLKPAENRRNLITKPLSQVTEVIINPHTKEAVGVKYINNDHLHIAKATKEVILSAGALNSAQLLMLSGVGPKEELQELNIPLIHDLPVGKQLKDHLMFLGLDFVVNETYSEELNSRDNLVRWLKSGEGPLSSVGSDALGYLKTNVSKDQSDYPDIEIVFSPHPHGRTYNALKSLRIRKDIYDAVWNSVSDKPSFSIGIVLMHPKSTGEIKLKSKDPFHWPLLYSKQLTDPDDDDIATVVAGVRKAIELTKTEPFHKVGAHLNEYTIPGCEHEFNSDYFWKCAIRHLSTSARHQTGTCKMGPSTDKEAIVDNKLHVYGVHKLRVADAGIIPVSVTGHLNAPAIMVGEKAADLIKEYWK